MRNKKLLIANWKMNPASLFEAKEIFSGIKEKASRFKNLNVVICPPHLYINNLKSSYSGKKIKFGAQDCFWETGSGSYTGEISATQLRNIGATYVIIGHSERRGIWDGEVEFGAKESSEIASKKVNSAIKEGLIPILCVGEKKRDENGEYLDMLRNEISMSLKGIKKEDVKNIILAYEPIWAIGKSSEEAIKSEDLHTMSIFVKKVISEIYTPDIGKETKVLYGGSVTPKNSEDLIKNGGVDGFLIGRASLEPDKFNKILAFLNS